MGKTVILLHRNDLRLRDQPAYLAAHQTDSKVDKVLPVFVFDERAQELSGLPDYKREGPEARTRLCGFWRSGPHKTRFLAEAVYDLQSNLKKVNSNLLVRFGKPEKIVASLAKALQADGSEVAVYTQKEFCSEELAVERKLAKALQQISVDVRYFDNTTLVRPEDLPFKLEDLPNVYTAFRTAVEKLDEMAKPPVDTPSKYKPCPSIPRDCGYGEQFDQEADPLATVLPYLLKPMQDSPQTEFDQLSDKSAVPFRGGETSALERVEYYFKEGEKGSSAPPVKKYKTTRNGMLGHSYSTKLSGFFAVGCISPKTVIQALDQYHQKHGETKDSYWVSFEMLWRDYFLFCGRKFGTKLFTLDGFEGAINPKAARQKENKWKPWDPKDRVLKSWLNGTTGIPLIDANMRELVQTGYMSNRGRQNVASFLIKDLAYYDWRIGAEYFEALLYDHEPCANSGNWQYQAGVGNDPRSDRQFNPIKQSKDYDADGSYVRHWIPELKNVPTIKVHNPWLLTSEEREKYGVHDYPQQPVVEQSSWKSHYNRSSKESNHGGSDSRKGNNRRGPSRGGRGRGGKH